MHETEERDEWLAPSGHFSPFVAVCGVGFLDRLSHEMARTPLTPLYSKHLGAPANSSPIKPCRCTLPREGAIRNTAVRLLKAPQSVRDSRRGTSRSHRR